LKRSGLYVPPSFFNKFDSRGNILCRIIECHRQANAPFRFFCTRSHKREFERWHFLNCTWTGVRLAIFRRDDYTCQKCGKHWAKSDILKLNRRNSRFLSFANVSDVVGTDLECDHIRPVIQLASEHSRSTKMRNYGNKPNPLKDFKFTHEVLLSYDNLRTLCYQCHANVTVNFARVRHFEMKLQSSAETAKAMINYYSLKNGR
jgi:5-methylcytosine-specific restriction endonuclease McrA